MRTRIQKWGNSLAVRIPKSYAIEARLEQDVLVELSLEDGKLVMQPVTAPEFTLKELLSQMTEDNLHSEVETGGATGKEIW